MILYLVPYTKTEYKVWEITHDQNGIYYEHIKSVINRVVMGGYRISDMPLFWCYKR